MQIPRRSTYRPRRVSSSIKDHQGPLISFRLIWEGQQSFCVDLEAGHATITLNQPGNWRLTLHYHEAHAQADRAPV